MSNIYANAQSNTGVCTLTATAAPGTTWNLSSLSVSMAGPTSGLNAKLTIYDGTVAAGTVLFACYLTGPGVTAGSVGYIQEIPLPKDALGRPCCQAITGNAMNIQVVGTGVDQVSINGRFNDGLPGT